MNTQTWPSKEIMEERKAIELITDEDRSEEQQKILRDLIDNHYWGSKILEENGKVGIVRWTGQVIIPPVFDNIFMLFSLDYTVGSHFAVFENGKMGVVKVEVENWRWILNPEFDYISFPSSIIAAQMGDKWKLFNLRTEKYLFEEFCDQVYLSRPFFLCNDIGFYKTGDHFGVVHSSGAFTKPIFDEVELDQLEGGVKVRVDSNWGFIDVNGNFTLESEDCAFVLAD